MSLPSLTAHSLDVMAQEYARRYGKAYAARFFRLLADKIEGV